MDKAELNKFVGKKIKEYRQKKNLTQKELGSRLGLVHSTISSYERGSISSDSDSLYSLAHELGVKIDSFFPPMELDSLDRIKDMQKGNMTPEDMLFFKKLVEKTTSMNDEERKKFLESIKFTVDYYDKMNE